MSSKEGIKSGDIFAGISLTLGILILSQFAFSISKRKKMGARDGWACQEDGCTRSFQKGWMVDAAHNSDRHVQEDPLYDYLDSGQIRCLDHHQAQQEKGTALGTAGDASSVNILSTRDRRTWDWRKKHPNAR